MGPQRQKPRASFFCSFLWYMGLARFCSGAVTWREGSIWWMKGGRGKAQELRITPASFRMGVKHSPLPPSLPTSHHGHPAALPAPLQKQDSGELVRKHWLWNLTDLEGKIWHLLFRDRRVWEGFLLVPTKRVDNEFPLCETFQASPGVQRLQELAHYGQSRGLLLLPCIRRWWGIPVLFHQNIY